MEIWQTIAASLACVLLLLHGMCLFFIRNRLIWNRLGVLISHSVSCIVYGGMIIITLLLRSNNALVGHFKIFYIGSAVPFYGSIIILMHRLHHRDINNTASINNNNNKNNNKNNNNINNYDTDNINNLDYNNTIKNGHNSTLIIIKPRLNERKIVTSTWCFYLIWLCLVYIVVYQYRVCIERVVTSGEHFLTLLGLSSVMVTFSCMALSTCCRNIKRKQNTGKEMAEEDNENNLMEGGENTTETTSMRTCSFLSLTTWFVSVPMVIFELVPQVVFLFVSETTFEWMVLCKLLQRVINGVICISFARSVWDQTDLLAKDGDSDINEEFNNNPSSSVRTMGRKQENNEVVKTSKYGEYRRKDSKTCGGDHQQKKRSIEEESKKYQKILVVVTDENENVREKTLFFSHKLFDTSLIPGYPV